MKAPRPRYHSFTAPFPLTNYVNLEVLCGVVLRNAEPVASRLEGEESAVHISSMRECANCRVKAYDLAGEKTGEQTKRWWYWLIEGAENLGASEGDNGA